MRTIIIAGTGAHGPLGRAFYAPLARALGGAEVVTLPWGGVGHTEEATSKLARRLLWGDDQATPLRLVGHSQGGLVAAMLALTSDQVASVITLGAPFGGSPIASWKLPTPAVRCMAAGSRALATLHEQWSYGQCGAFVTTVAGARDFIAPEASAHGLAGSHLRRTVDTGHLGLVTDPAAIGVVVHLAATR